MSEKENKCDVHNFLKDNLKIKTTITFNRVTTELYLRGEKISSSWDTIN
jgi:hypothetical protein